MIQKMIATSLALFLSFVLCSVSGAANLKEKIIGKWVEVDENGSYGQELEFVKDGTVVVGSSPGTYKFIDDKRVQIDQKIKKIKRLPSFAPDSSEARGEQNAVNIVKVFEVSLYKEGRRLILIDPEGHVQRYEVYNETFIAAQKHNEAIRTQDQDYRNEAAYSDLRNMRTTLEVCFVDFVVFGSPNMNIQNATGKIFICEGGDIGDMCLNPGVMVSLRTSSDGQSYTASAKHKHGSVVYAVWSGSPRILRSNNLHAELPAPLNNNQNPFAGSKDWTEMERKKGEAW